MSLDKLTKAEAAGRLRRLADVIESGGALSSEVFEQGCNVARASYQWSQLPEKTQTREGFEAMGQYERSQFVKNGGRVVDAP